MKSSFFPSTIASVLHGVFPGPLLGELGVPVPVGLVDPGDLGDQRVVRIGVAEEGTDGKEDFTDGEGWGPLGSQDVQADGTVGVDVGVVDLCCEGNLGWLERVVCGEVYGEEEHATLKRAVAGTHNSCLPMK